MSDIGDLYLADVGAEVRQSVLVVSDHAFHELAGRALVAPAIRDPAADTGTPWRVTVGRDMFLLDRLHTLPLSRLLECRATAPSEVIDAARRTIRAITS